MQTNYHQNFELLCSFLAQEHSGSKSAPYTKSEIKSIDWERIFQLADGYLVIPALYLNLRRKGYLTFLDKEAREFLEVIYELNCEHNHLLKEEALSVIRLLNSKRIRPVLLKGIAGLLSGLYEDDGERIMGDVDLLVDQSELITVVELLLNHGYRCDQDICDQVFEGRFFKRELTIMTASNSVKIDLHIRPVGSSGEKAFVSAEEAKGDAEAIEVDGASALLPSPFFRLMHNFFHAQHLDQSYLSALIDLRQLIDWIRLWQRYGSEVRLSKIDRKVRIHRKSRSFDLYIYTAEQYLRFAMPTGRKVGRIEKALFHRQRLSMQYHWFYRVNSLLVFFTKMVQLFTPEGLRSKYGDLPMWQLVVLRIKRFFEPDWYWRRLGEMKSLWR